MSARARNTILFFKTPKRTRRLAADFPRFRPIYSNQAFSLLRNCCFSFPTTAAPRQARPEKVAPSIVLAGISFLTNGCLPYSQHHSVHPLLSTPRPITFTSQPTYPLPALEWRPQGERRQLDCFYRYPSENGRLDGRQMSLTGTGRVTRRRQRDASKLGHQSSLGAPTVTPSSGIASSRGRSKTPPRKR